MKRCFHAIATWRQTKLRDQGDRIRRRFAGVSSHTSHSLSRLRAQLHGLPDPSTASNVSVGAGHTEAVPHSDVGAAAEVAASDGGARSEAGSRVSGRSGAERRSGQTPPWGTCVIRRDCRCGCALRFCHSPSSMSTCCPQVRVAGRTLGSAVPPGVIRCCLVCRPSMGCLYRALKTPSTPRDLETRCTTLCGLCTGVARWRVTHGRRPKPVPARRGSPCLVHRWPAPAMALPPPSRLVLLSRAWVAPRLSRSLGLLA